MADLPHLVLFFLILFFAFLFFAVCCFVLLLINLALQHRQNKITKRQLESNVILKRIIEVGDPKKQVIFGRISFHANCWFASAPLKRVWISMDKRGTIDPSSLEKQQFFLAYELAHIQKPYLELTHECKKSFRSCLADELETNVWAINILREAKAPILNKAEINFWCERLMVCIGGQCEECQKVIKNRRCPRETEVYRAIYKIIKRVKKFN